MPTPTVRALVLGDTHTTATGAEALVVRLQPQIEAADLIFHTGDITDAAVLEQLASYAEVHAVLGNNDVGLDLPQRLTVPVAGCEVAIVHDSGQAHGRSLRLRKWFPAADVVLFGHSHLPWHLVDVGPTGHVQHHLNPGSATLRRRAPACSVAWIEFSAGRVVGVRHEDVAGSVSGRSRGRGRSA